MKDCIPTLNHNFNYRNEDLKLIDFTLIRIKDRINIYYVPVYILTDGVVSLGRDVYETMVRIGYIEHSKFLDVQEQCFSKLEAYQQHKMIYKKLIKGFYDKEIIKIIRDCGVTYKND